MTTQASSDQPTLESLAEGQRQLTSVVAELGANVGALGEAVASLTTAVNRLTSEQERLWREQQSMRRDIVGLNEKFDGLADEQRSMKRDFADMSGKVDGLTEKVDGLRDDIGLVKGGHARAEMLRKVGLIADELDYQIVSELPRGTIIALGKSAQADGMARNEVESFRNADMILLGQHESGKPGYLAIEVSFTVGESDVRRAVRNAGYLEKYTGLQSCPVVAGAEILPEARRQVDEGDVHFHQIAKRELQAQ